MNIQSITEIREHRDKVKNSLRGFRVSQFEDRYGKEQEYTAQGIRAGVGSILIDVTALTKAPAKLIQKSTYNERRQIASCLADMNSYLENQDLNSLAIHIDVIKPILRSIGIRHTDDRMEVFDEHINDLQKRASNLNQDIAGIEEVKSTANNLQEEIRSRHQELTEELATLQSQNESLAELINSTEKATKDYEEKLKGFRVDHEKYLEDAGKLIENAKIALEYKTAEGLSAAFTEQYNKADNIKPKIVWLLSAGVFVVVAVGMGFWLVTGETLPREIIIARFSLIPVLIAVAWFCAGQYVKQRNIAEDYAYKATLAKSIVGFSEQLSTESNKGEDYSYFMQRVLAQMLNDPLRKHSPESPARFRFPKGSKRGESKDEN